MRGAARKAVGRFNSMTKVPSTPADLVLVEAGHTITVTDPTPAERAAWRRVIYALINSDAAPARYRLRHSGRDHGDLTIRLVPARTPTGISFRRSRACAAATSSGDQSVGRPSKPMRATAWRWRASTSSTWTTPRHPTAVTERRSLGSTVRMGRRRNEPGTRLGVTIGPERGAERMSVTPESLTPPAAASAELTLTPPAPVAAVAPAQAEGMVPIDAAAVPGLDAKVAEYVDGIVDLDVHSPAFAAKAGDVASMGDDDIRAAAETSNRLLASPVRAMQQGPLSEGAQGRRRRCSTSGARSRTSTRSRRPATKKLLGMIPFGDKIARLLPQVRERAVAHRRDHQGALRRPGRAAQGQRRARAGEGAPLGDDAAAHAVHLHRPASRRGARREDRRDRGDRSREGQGAARRRPVLRAPEAPGPAHPAGGVDPGLPGDRPRPEEQPRAHQGRRPRDDDHGRGAADRGDRRPGAREPEARARPDHGAQHDDVEAHRVDVGAARDPERRHQQAGRVDHDRASSRCRPRSRTSTSRWTRSTRSRCRRSTRWRRRSPRSRPRSASRRPTWQRVRAADARGAVQRRTTRWISATRQPA